MEAINKVQQATTITIAELAKMECFIRLIIWLMDKSEITTGVY